LFEARGMNHVVRQFLVGRGANFEVLLLPPPSSCPLPTSDSEEAAGLKGNM
jgi:hypothetical protein